MDDAQAGLQGAGPFLSLAEMRKAHVELVRAERDRNKEKAGADPTGAVRAFLVRARLIGARLDDLSDRDAAQAMLDYWAAELIVRTRDPQSDMPGPTLLAQFDPTLLPDLSAGTLPYKGLDAFGTDDAGRLIGREVALVQLLKLVREHGCVVVHGPPGIGKTSLVMAGLVPRIASPAPDAGRSWLQTEMIAPGADPMAALQLVTAGLQADGPPALIVVGPFEDVFTQGASAATQEAFAKALTELARRHKVVLTVGDAYLSATLALPGLHGSAVAVFAVPPLDRNELRRVIEQPAALAGLRFEPGIVDDIVEDLTGEPATLPLLQFALHRLWDLRDRDRVTWEAYQKVGRPRQALARAAEAVCAELPPDQQDATRRLFLYLLRPAEGDGVVCQRAGRAELRHLLAPMPADRLLERWTRSGLLRLMPGREPEQDRFSVTHSVLAQTWPRLAAWLREERERSKGQLRLESTARLWQSSRHRGYLLKGAALEEAAQYQGQSSEIAALVKASIAAERAAHRRLMLVIGGVAVLLLALLAIAIWQAVDASRARDNARLARDQEHYLRGYWEERASDLIRTRAIESQDIKASYQGMIDALQQAIDAGEQAALRQALGNLGVNVPSDRRVLLTSQTPPAVQLQIRPTAPLPTSDPVRGLRPASAGPAFEPECDGVIWIGPTASAFTDPMTPDSSEWKGKRLTLARPARLRRGPPSGDYRTQDSITDLPADTQVEALDAPSAYQRPSGTQYWLSVRVAGRACNTVYVQYTGGKPDAISQIAAGLRGFGYTVPDQEALSVAKGLSQIRFYHEQDRAAAEQLATALGVVAEQNGITGLRKVTLAPLLSWKGQKPQPGTLELWLDLSPAG